MKKGFTVIELLIVFIFILITTSVGIAYYNRNNQQLALKTEAKKLADVLDLARKKAESSELIPTLGSPVTYCNNFNGYLVGLTSNQYLLKYRCNSIDTILSTYNFPSSITYTGSSYDFNFLPVNVGTKITQNTLMLKNNNTNECIVINIASNGIIQINETLISCP